MKVLGKFADYQPYYGYMLVLFRAVILKLLIAKMDASVIQLPENAVCSIQLRSNGPNLGNRFGTHQSNITGICLRRYNCPHLLETMEKLKLDAFDVHCGFLAYESLSCCPKNKINAGKLQQGERANNACANFKRQIHSQQQISGGTAVVIGEFPHMAALVHHNKIICGGTLIEDRFVLTAAHCINTRMEDEVKVYFGMTKLTDQNQMKDAVIRSVQKYHIHSGYNSLEKYDDIALIELTDNVPFVSYIYPACLHTDPTEQLIGVELYVTGWGIGNTQNRVHSDTLQKARVRAISLEACKNKYINPPYELSRGILETLVCTLDTNHKNDACKGDSGGPLSRILDDDYKGYSVVGVIASGEGCASSMPGLYTRVSRYLEFIENIVWK